MNYYISALLLSIALFAVTGPQHLCRGGGARAGRGVAYRTDDGDDLPH